MLHDLGCWNIGEGAVWGAGGMLIGALLIPLVYGGQWALSRVMAWGGAAATAASADGDLANEIRSIAGALQGFTRLGINQVINRGVRPYEILDAIRNPRNIMPGRDGVTRYIGECAEILINSVGKVVTVIRHKPPNAP